MHTETFLGLCRAYGSVSYFQMFTEMMWSHCVHHENLSYTPQCLMYIHDMVAK